MPGRNILILLLFFGINSFGQSSSKIFVSARTNGILQNGYGVTITVTNVESKKEYNSKSLGIFSSHSYIDNLPFGRYVVTKMEIPLGSVVYINRSDELMEYFDTLNVELGSINYLGNFVGFRSVGDSAVFSLSIKEDKVPSKLIKKACKKGIIPNKVNWIKHYPYKEKEFMFFEYVH